MTPSSRSKIFNLSKTASELPILNPHLLRTNTAYTFKRVLCCCNLIDQLPMPTILITVQELDKLLKAV